MQFAGCSCQWLLACKVILQAARHMDCFIAEMAEVHVAESTPCTAAELDWQQN